MQSLGRPSDFLPQLQQFGSKNPHAKGWKLRIERKTNRHTTSQGRDWGWYELWPLGIELGFWDNGTGEDDLQDVDITAWNKEAEEL